MKWESRLGAPEHKQRFSVDSQDSLRTGFQATLGTASQSGHLSHDRPVVSSGNFPDSSPASARLETRDDEPSHIHDAHDNGGAPDERVCKTIGTAHVEAHARLEGKEQLH